MRQNSWKHFGVLVAVLSLNAFVILQVTGVAYEPFSWKAFAFVYNTYNTCDISPDADGDCILDPRDPDDEFFNPSGCFYDSKTGEIVSGGMVASANDLMNCGPAWTGPAGGAGAGDDDDDDCHVYIPDGGDPMDGSQGCYAFLLKAPESGLKCAAPEEAGCGSELPAPIQLAFTLPPVCAIDTLFCPPSGAPFSPPANFNEMAEVLGSPPNAGRTALEGAGFVCPGDPGCECPNNPWYSGIDLSQSTPPDNGGTVPFIPVVQNNIPLLCDTPLGEACIPEAEPSHCASGYCAERELTDGPGGVCCNSPCDGPNQVCDIEGREGSCFTRAPAPLLSPTGMATLLGILLAVAGLGFWRRRESV